MRKEKRMEEMMINGHGIDEMNYWDYLVLRAKLLGIRGELFLKRIRLLWLKTVLAFMRIR